MRYQNPELRQTLAGEYVLGTLQGGARKRFVRLLSQDAELQAQVNFWQERFGDIASALAPVAPRALVWTHIEQEINRDAAKVRPLPVPETPPSAVLSAVAANDAVGVKFWRGLAVFASLASLVMAAGLWQLREQNQQLEQQMLALQTAPMPFVAVIKPDGGDAQWTVSMHVDKSMMRVKMDGTKLPVDRNNHSVELWVIDHGGSPRSLGILPTEASSPHNMPLPKMADAGSADIYTLAISLEPRGGSPTGKPTGKVMAVAPAARAI